MPPGHPAIYQGRCIGPTGSAAIPLRNVAYGSCMDGARGARGNLTFLRSVRVRSCIRPVVAWRITSVAMQPLWPLALM